MTEKLIGARSKLEAAIYDFKNPPDDRTLQQRVDDVLRLQEIARIALDASMFASSALIVDMLRQKEGG